MIYVYIEYMIFLLLGLVVGFVMSISVGPVSILTIHRTLHKGLKFGIISGMGVALADVFFAYISKFSVVLVQDFILEHKLIIQSVASIVFVALGVYFFFAPKPKFHSTHAKKSLFKNFGSAFLLNIINPLNFVIFGFIFMHVLKFKENMSMSQDIFLLVGIFLGASGRWALMNRFVSRFRVSLDRLYVLNKIIGLLIAGLGILSLLKVIFD